MDYRVLLLVLLATMLASGQGGRGGGGGFGKREQPPIRGGHGKRAVSRELEATELRQYDDALAVRQRVRRELNRYDLSEQLPELTQARAEEYSYGGLKQDIGDLIESLASHFDGETKSVKETRRLKKLVQTLRSYNEAVRL
ncbi:uncharacterized protein [Oscarella lobularis]|uniref:uncharacterized protein isoform X2 n=1 Tax=Oscarella lobularis TaxID=121494 RepID=UPI003314274D